MPEVDLSSQIPVEARWIKIHYGMKSTKEGADLIARLWSGNLDDAVVIKGSEGDAFVKLEVAQKLWYQRPVGVDLQLKVVAFKVSEEK